MLLVCVFGLSIPIFAEIVGGGGAGDDGVGVWRMWV